ncbi:hypothetical protein PHYSODRAFT_323092 [Phytophthora sojae]|uniref:Uncharacterized protein n=1 Tax=Phytophthora sojae (strain P6497) TaxID=1094619 RepID=G4YQ78_PHYSP|nr:hypothetical protein PHYSODRAFT_323092 [Phytophthora sojae]EGZ29582.1 hypothetical protein PHYSODRAFT_323092 [Phytophthora sojae]|eukprot:XP_009516857.1 hypothetical protein PHYSODRAFT_323092 [Phytophthora sojae]
MARRQETRVLLRRPVQEKAEQQQQRQREHKEYEQPPAVRGHHRELPAVGGGRLRRVLPADVAKRIASILTRRAGEDTKNGGGW